MTTRTLEPAPLGFHGDTHLRQLVGALAPRAEVFLETGSNVGSSLADIARSHPHLDCFSCEPDADAYSVAREHTAADPRVRLFPETSQAFLTRLERDHSDQFDRPLLAWLDAHGYGYDWPLRDEVSALTRCFERGSILIDDFRVPGRPEFGFDEYQGQICAWEFIDDAIDSRVAFRLLYPAYSEHTSPWHPLRGWGLLQFAPTLDELPRIEAELEGVLQLARVRSEEHRAVPLMQGEDALELADSIAASLMGDAACDTGERQAELVPAPAPDRIGMLRAQSISHPGDPMVWHDLGVCLVMDGDRRGGLQALARALELDPSHPECLQTYGTVARESRDDGRVIPVAAGERGRMVRRDPYLDLVQLVDVDAPVVVDGGANRGDTVARFRALFPSAMIHAFEAVPDLAQAVRRRFGNDERLVVHSAAMAATGGTVPFHVLGKDVMSSTFEASDLKRRYHQEAADTVRELEVLATPLDDAVRTPVDILKLDLQGGELDALKGFSSGLGNVRALLVEVEFAALYDGQPLFSDVEQYLRTQGFRLFNLYELWTHTDGQMTSGDAIFVNERYFV